MEKVTKKYSNGEVTVVWKPDMCIHSTICWKGAGGLREVFNPLEKPWIKPEGASTERIVEQVKKCPSGALSYYMNSEAGDPVAVSTENIVEVMQDGPLLVYGNITVKKKDGDVTHNNKVTAFCRCGQSSNKPYCDGTHTKTGFKG